MACFFGQKSSNVAAICKEGVTASSQWIRIVFLQMRLRIDSNSWWMRIQGA